MIGKIDNARMLILKIKYYDSLITASSDIALESKWKIRD